MTVGNCVSVRLEEEGEEEWQPVKILVNIVHRHRLHGTVQGQLLGQC